MHTASTYADRYYYYIAHGFRFCLCLFIQILNQDIYLPGIYVHFSMYKINSISIGDLLGIYYMTTMFGI